MDSIMFPWQCSACAEVNDCGGEACGFCGGAYKELAVGRHAGETGTNENNRISLDEDEEGAVWLVSLNKAEIKKQLKAKNE